VRPKGARSERLGARETAEFLSGLSELLAAGSDIRTALGILGARFERSGLRRVGEALAADIAGGEPLDRAFARAFQTSQAFVAPMVAAGEAAGDLPGGLQRAAEVIQSRLKLRDQLTSVLAYPAFVLASAVVAVLVILLYIVPSVGPLATELGGASTALSVMIAASDFLRANLSGVAIGLAGAIALVLLAARAGLLTDPIDRLLLDGLMRRTAGGLIYGGFALSLGTMIGAGAPVDQALRLATRTIQLRGARRRVEPLSQSVRQGEFLSAALAEVKGFPPAIIRLTAVGEASNRLGAMLQRGGRMEEEAALRRIEAVGRIAGPALILLLGAFLGVLMGSLLSGVSQMGQSALQ
jgi:type II secretory pathway component PulF